MVDKKISKYFSELAKKRTDNNRGFSNAEVAKKAQALSVAKRKENANKKSKGIQSEVRP